LDRVLATQFVEGFEAADASRISERSLAAQGGTSEQSREMRAGRLLDGYGALVDRLAAPLLSRIERGVTVSAVRWRRGHVEVECRDQADAPLPLIRARAAVITVPVGVLAAPPDARGAIRFEPAVPGLAQILSGLVMGHVVKLMLRFADAFWTDEPFGHRVGAPDLDQASFLHSRARVPFPVWWTTYPVRAPLLVAWAGGPAAEAMSRNSPEELERAAVASLAAILGAAPRTIRRKLLAVHHHDWTADPFSRGAYSYAAVGGDRAATRLSHSVAQTLWFAGEGTAGGADAGTVHGAIASGCRAARGITARRT
jgi:monoamine oxidase